MDQQAVLASVKTILDHLPSDWVKLTTHRLDIYDEARAKSEFLEVLEKRLEKGSLSEEDLSELPTAYDYIRLGHPLSSVLEWALAGIQGLPANQVIAFSSRTTPLLAILRTNTLKGISTQVYVTGNLLDSFDLDRVKNIYGYALDIHFIRTMEEFQSSDAPTVVITHRNEIGKQELPEGVDFLIQVHSDFGSIAYINTSDNEAYVSAIQHVRRRESIAMTPVNCLAALKWLLGKEAVAKDPLIIAEKKKEVVDLVQQVTHTQSNAVLGSSGLSVQYAIMMGLIDHAMHTHPGKEIKFLVPPNCYGGTNDQARRVAASVEGVEILDLPVDGDNDMVQSVNRVLDEVAQADAVPFIIAEIPTNPRVEVPVIEDLHAALIKKRKTHEGTEAIAPVFILDQTFCPNVPFLAEGGLFREVQALAYVSGSKFPSGGKCTAGYCAANNEAEHLMTHIQAHILLCDNEATDHQIEVLAEQMPSMNERIAAAYENTRGLVGFIEQELPEAKINFVSEELAKRGFTPSVFSLDLPTKGDTHEEREEYKRALNLKLINMMITEIPEESKYCVSYGQLKGCYWTIPATSTQGTTKESDKDYIARVSVSGKLDLDKHKQVFSAFVKEIG
jgi:cystathionine beta-lyase/cystathionine gamma-synthase